ncbi:hypothetical protein HAX54_008629, partial [Datura stramonium]|nr:hypothetical protein [Datura stramonium]
MQGLKFARGWLKAVQGSSTLVQFQTRRGTEMALGQVRVANIPRHGQARGAPTLAQGHTRSSTLTTRWGVRRGIGGSKK